MKDVPKTYVQDLLAKEEDMLRRVLTEEKGHFYICGSLRMGNDVQALLKSTLGDESYKQMQSEKRLCVELWS